MIHALKIAFRNLRKSSGFVVTAIVARALAVDPMVLLRNE
jgi:hypothetical protein